MGVWSDKPPTYREWIDAKNHGCWWVKFLLHPAGKDLVDGFEPVSWGEVWFTEVVTITCSHEQGQLFSRTGKLHASGSLLREFDLDDTEKTQDVYWQPVVAPTNDIKDERPKC